MESSARFKTNGPKIIHEAFDDGEVMIVNLENGNYFNLNNAGAEIWKRITGGATVKEIVASINGNAEYDRVELKTEVNRFVGELHHEGLIVPIEASECNNSNSLETSVHTRIVEQKHDFEKPIIQKYDDMQDLLLLDPIHEVDETGWPNAKSLAADGNR